MDMLSSSRPPDGGGSLGSAASELSSAARSLQMSQGAMSNQSQSISQLGQQQQQQQQQLMQMIGSLNFSISQLATALSQTSGSARMASMAPPTMPVGPMMGMDMSGTMASMADSARSAAAMAASGLRVAGGAMIGAGRMGLGLIGSGIGAMAAPFIPGSYMGPAQGQIMGTVGNAGFARSAMMGTGLTSQHNRYGSNFAMSTEAAAQRAGFKFGEIGIGALGGMANVGASLGLGMLGDKISPWSGLGGMAGGLIGGQLGGERGAMVGSVMGNAIPAYLARGALGAGLSVGTMGVGMLAQATIGKVIDKVGEIRGSGEMINRNAFRFMDPNASRNMSMRDRATAGSNLTRMADEDLSFSVKDMQEIFAGGVENDMFRGANTMQQVQRRMRELKNTVKMMGQTMGTSIRESMEVMNDLQSVGVDTGSMQSAMSGFSVAGLTNQEAMSGQMDFMRRYQNTGLQGRGLLSLASTSQNLGQSAMRNGMLSAETIAAVGGREGVNRVMAEGMVGMTQGGLGAINMAARMGGGRTSTNALTALGQAGAAASSENLISFAANQGSMQRDLLGDPRARTDMFQQVMSIADQYEGLGNRKDTIKLVLKQMTGLDGPQADAMMKMFENEPQALRDKQAMLSRSLGDMQANQISEKYSVRGIAGRSIDRAAMWAATPIAASFGTAGDMVSNSVTAMRDSVFGIEKPIATRKEDMTVAAIMSANLAKPLDDAGSKIMNAKPTPEKLEDAKIAVKAAASRGGDDYVKLRDEDDNEAKKAAANRLIDKLAGEIGDPNDAATRKAIAMALGAETGVDVASLVFGSGDGPSASGKAKAEDIRDDIRGNLTTASGRVAAGSLGSSIGTLLGIVTMPLLGPASIALGGIVGGALGASEYGSMDIVEEDIGKISRSPSAKKMLEAKKKLKSGNISEAERVALTKQFNQARTEMEKEGIAPSAITQLEGLEGSKLDSMISTLGKSEGIGQENAVAAFMSEGMRASKTAAMAAGLDDVAIQLSGGAGNLTAALQSVAGLDEKAKKELASKGGEALINAASITADMSVTDLASKLGISEQDAAGFIKADGTIDFEKAQQYAIGSGSARTSSNVMATGSGNFTTEQMQMQSEIMAQVQQTAKMIGEVAEVVKQLQK